MQQNQRLARAPFNVMQPNAVHIEKPTGRRIVLLRFVCKMSIEQGDCGQHSNRSR